MAAAPPSWFVAALDQLVRFGLPELDDHRRDDLWGGWQERWRTDPPAEASTTLARAISLYPGCAWTCSPLRATPASARFRGWLEQLAAISHGALVITEVEEVWLGRVTVKVRFTAGDRRFELFPRHTQGHGLLRELLDAATAAADRVVFHELVVDRGENDEGDHGGDDDADDGDDDGDDGEHHRATIVGLPRAVARKLGAAGVRFVEWSPPAPPPRGRVTRWLETLGLVQIPPVPVPPPTAIRRLADRPSASPAWHAPPAAAVERPESAPPVAAPPHDDRATALAPRHDGPLLSEILAGATGRIAEALAPHARPVFRPVTEPGESADHASKFGGRPWLRPGERPARCTSCDRPMSLAVQLDLAALPPALRATGLLQCFVCLEDQQARARVVDPARRAITPTAAELPARAIVGWTAQRDELPGPAHWASLGVALDAVAAAVAEDELDEPDERDKLGGWPAYIQQASLGRCARCDRPRALLLQVESDGHLAAAFGDSGRLFVATCPDHPDAVEARIEYY